MCRVLTCLAREHDGRLVVLAAAVCLLASLIAIGLIRRSRTAQGAIRAAWTTAAGGVAGGGIWATHVIALQAYDPGVAIQYGFGFVAASLIAAVTVTSAGFWFAINGPTQWRAVLGGAAVGGGIACVHYLGMWALHVPGSIGWSADLVVISVVLGVLFGAAALVVADRRDDPAGTFAAALLLTLALLLHHVTAMGAVDIMPDPSLGGGAPSWSSGVLAIAIALAAAAMLGMILFGAFADMRLRERANWLHLAINNMSQGFLLFDREERLVAANDRYAEMYGLPPGAVKPGITLRELIQQHVAAGVIASDSGRYRSDLLAARRQRTPITNVVEISGGRSFRISDQPMPDGGWLALHEDITERRQAENAARAADAAAKQAHARLLDAFEMVPEGLVMLDEDDRYVLWNRRFEEIYPVAQGARFEDNVRAGVEAGLHLDALGREDAWLVERLERHRRPQDAHEQHLAGDRWVRIEERRTAGGGSIGLRIDITDLRRREDSFRLLFDGNPAPMWVYDRDSLRFVAVNDAAVEKYGYSREQFLDMTVLDIRPLDDRKDVRFGIETNKGRVQGRPRRHLKADGAAMDVVIYARSLSYQGGNCALVTAIDVTERKRAEDDVRRTREFLNTLIEHVPAMIIVKDARDLRYVLVNRSAEDYFGMSRDKIIGNTAADIFPEASATAIAACDDQLLQTLQPQQVSEYSLLLPGHESRIVSSTRVPILAEDGKPQYLVTVIQDVTEVKYAQARVQYMAHIAHHDPLTDLPNRAAFNERLAAALGKATDGGEAFALMCIDLDHFKEVNDLFGHALGDALLREVSRRLWAAAEGEFIARLGGDEFVAIAPAAAAEGLAERMLANVPGELDIEGHRVSIGLSIGGAVCPNDGVDATTLLGNADAALYRAKAGGRGLVRFFDAETDRRLRELQSLQNDLEPAIERGEFSLHYQPQATIDGEVIGFEALLRWYHPTRDLVPARTFIPLAEKTGLILRINEWRLLLACREAASWPRALGITVNLSPVQFRHGDLPALVDSILAETGLAPRRLELDVTESVLSVNPSRALSILDRLKTIGVRIAMDSFGTGNSSLASLRSFPLDRVKIDRSFTSTLDRDPRSAAMVRAIIGLARGFDLPVAAVGVENEEQVAFLAREACGEMQGNLVGRPLPIEQYARLLGREPAAEPAAEPVKRVVEHEA